MDEEDEYFKEIEDLFSEIIGNESSVDGRRTRGKKIGNLQGIWSTSGALELLSNIRTAG